MGPDGAGNRKHKCPPEAVPLTHQDSLAPEDKQREVACTVCHQISTCDGHANQAMSAYFQTDRLGGYRSISILTFRFANTTHDCLSTISSFEDMIQTMNTMRLTTVRLFMGDQLIITTPHRVYVC